MKVVRPYFLFQYKGFKPEILKYKILTWANFTKKLGSALL